MIKAAIEKILSLGGSKAELINGRTYSNGPRGITTLKPPKAESLIINTLTGIVDFGVLDEAMIHIVSPTQVNIIDKFLDSEGWKTRSTYLLALHKSPVFRFGQWFNLCSQNERWKRRPTSVCPL